MQRTGMAAGTQSAAGTIFAFILMVLPVGARAQDALVLSGGGSRGLAHAGAIAGLERRGLQPGLVVGTSMGAIIGGLYATGMDSDSIWELTRTQDWQQMFSPSADWIGPNGEIVRPMVRLSPLADRTRYMDGLIPAWRVNRSLVRLFLDASFRARGDFDSLPRRFRSVAADLSTGEPVVLARGDLARAIRASMSVPGVFAPVLMDGAPLVDGGLADYLPVGPARDAGAESVVAVDVIRPPVDEVGLNPFQVALRSFRMTLYNARADGDSAEITIAPAIDPDLFAAVFLRDPTPLLEAGLRAALALPDTLGGGSPPSPPRPAPDSFAGMRVEANDSGLVRLVRRAFVSATRHGYDRNAILDAVDDLYATGLFTGIWPRIEPGGTADTLVVLAEGRAPTTVMGAGGYDTDRGFRGWVDVSHRVGSRLEASLTGKATGVESWASADVRYRPSDGLPGLGLEAGVSIEGNDVRAFAGDDPVAEFRTTRAGGWLGFGWRALAPDIEAVALLNAERIDDRPSDGLAIGPTLRVSRPLPNGTPVGEPLRIEAEWRYGDFEYRRFHGGGSVALRRGGLSAALVGDFATVRGTAPLDAFPALGDGHALPGLRWGRLRDRTTAVAGIDFAMAAPLESHARLRLRAGAATHDPSDLDQARWLAGVELDVLWWTPLGGLVLEAGVLDGGNWRFGLDIGQAF